MSTTSAHEQANPLPAYSIGVSNDDGDCCNIVIRLGDRPIAKLIAPEGEVEPLVRAGNCYKALLDALKAAEEGIEAATDVLFSGQDGTPVSRLKAADIEHVYFTLCGVTVEVHEAIGAAES
jgi:hypothetical protein